MEQTELQYVLWAQINKNGFRSAMISKKCLKTWSLFQKFVFFILRGFFFFWSVAFGFPDILLLQTNNPTPRIRKRIWRAAQLRVPGLRLPGPSRENQGDSLRYYSASGQREAGKLPRRQASQGTSPEARAAGRHHADSQGAPRERFLREMGL